MHLQLFGGSGRDPEGRARFPDLNIHSSNPLYSKEEDVKRPTTRRDFLKATAATGIGFWVAGSDLTAADDPKSPSDKLNFAVIGCGGKGHGDLNGVKHHNVVAICDVDEKQAAGARKENPDAKFYHDYRELLEKEKTVDAVIVSTPDHTHAPASLMAMRLGKHVYCQKPLTHLVSEARLMRDTAKKMKVATQMGNQGSAESGLREGVEVIQSGAIGPVKEVHVWSNRPIWPQGFDKQLAEQPVPAHVKWDLWLGVAPFRPYNEAYCPFKWRGWWDFGTGALGDMACHTANLPFRALKLEYPIAIEAQCDKAYAESPPKWSVIRFDFPARQDLPTVKMPPVKFFWYDGVENAGRNHLPKDVVEGLDLAAAKGGKKRKKVETLKAGDIPGSGCLIVGEKGKLFSPDDYGSAYKLFPQDDFEGFKPPQPTIERLPFGKGSDNNMKEEWIRAIKGGPPAYSNFDIAAFLTEIILLGNLALRVPKRIEWDGPNMKSPNCPEVDEFVQPHYRTGYFAG
jgi:hypothetical protein